MCSETEQVLYTFVWSFVPSLVRSSSNTRHIQYNTRSYIGLIGGYFLDFEVEVVTACSWTELVVAADMPVLVEFWAPGRESCQVVDEVANEYSGKALCYKLNIDDYPNVALQYGITSIPSVLFYKNGENKEILVGDVSKSTLCATLDKYLC